MPVVYELVVYSTTDESYRRVVAKSDKLEVAKKSHKMPTLQAQAKRQKWKDQASVIGAAVGSGIGMVAGDLLQPYTGQYTKTISTIAGAAAGTYVVQQLHKGAKPKSTKEGKTK